MTEIKHRFVDTNGIRMHIAEAGQGPLVVLLHGFPEIWYSWRHQLLTLAEANYHVVVPDQRGFGQTDSPAEIEAYTQLHMIGDIIGLIDALEEEEAVIVGHDLGAVIAWNTALMRPDRIRGVAGFGIPYTPRGPADFLTFMRASVGERYFLVYFQQPGVAEAEFERDTRTMLRTFFYSASGDVAPGRIPLYWLVPEGGGLLDLMVNPETLPAWLTEQDMDYYASEFRRTGFNGSLNWFRNHEKNWELTGAWANTLLQTRALFIVGERDPFLDYPGSREMVASLQAFIPNIKETIILPGCGHWVQQERPADVNAALLTFLQGLPS